MEGSRHGTQVRIPSTSEMVLIRELGSGVVAEWFKRRALEDSRHGTRVRIPLMPERVFKGETRN